MSEQEEVTVFHNGASNCDPTFEEGLTRFQAMMRIEKLATQGIFAIILEDHDR